MINIKKYIFVFSLTAFFIFPYKVAANDITFDICNDGFPYKIKASEEIETNFFYENNIHLSYNSNYTDRPNWASMTAAGKTFNYTSIGAWNDGGNSKKSTRCYTVKSQNNSLNNGSSSNTTYTPQFCGSQFNLSKLEFVTSSNNPSGYTNQQISSNGKVTLVIKATGELATNFNRLKISSRNYSGDIGKVSYNQVNKTITISDITPSKHNLSATYAIGFYIEGIIDKDFNNVSGDVNSYIESCGGANGGYYLGKLTTAIIPETDVVVVNKPEYVNSLCSELSNINTSDLIKDTLVPECSSNHKFYYSQLSNLQSTISDKINKLKELYANVNNVKGLVAEDDILCTNNKLGLPSRGAPSSQPFESKVTYENYGTYFGMICVESYYVDAGFPSLVKPGVGVEYSNGVEIKKSCSIFQISQVVKKPQCQTNISSALCLASTTDQTWTGGSNGGPTDNFDKCVTNCDGGKYTQSCINSCYKSTYNDERSKNLTLSTNLKNRYDFTKIENNVKKISNPTATINNDNCSLTWNGYTSGTFEVCDVTLELDVNPNEWYTSADYNKLGRTTITSNGNVLFTNGYSQYCNNHNNTCTVNVSVGPAGCSNNPDTEYNNQVIKAKSELHNYEEIAKRVNGIETYTISFTDSKTGDVYEISGSTADNNNDEPRLQIIKDDSNDRTRKVQTSYIIGSNGETEDGISFYSNNVIYDIKLPITYSKTDNADIVAIKGNIANTYYTYKPDKITKKENGLAYYNFAKLSDYYPKVTFNEALFSKGKHVYYTNLYSDNYNVAINDKRYNDILEKLDYAQVTINGKTDTYVLVNNNSNIKVKLKISTPEGYQGFELADNISCYYGVYQPGNLVSTSEKDEGDSKVPESTPGEGEGNDTNIIPPGGSNKVQTIGGLKYYYREIDLTDVFPNGRNPRWNWSGTIYTNTDGSSYTTGASNNDNLAYLVDPTKLIQSIESKGNSIFTNTNEDDYSYTLTRNQINIIRAYNKQKKDGKRITYLDFSLAGNTLKNTYSEKIKEWFPNLNTTNITECNNAFNNACDNEWRLSS